MRPAIAASLGRWRSQRLKVLCRTGLAEGRSWNGALRIRPRAPTCMTSMMAFFMPVSYGDISAIKSLAAGPGLVLAHAPPGGHYWTCCEPRGPSPGGRSGRSRGRWGTVSQPSGQRGDRAEHDQWELPLGTGLPGRV